MRNMLGRMGSLFPCSVWGSVPVQHEPVHGEVRHR